MYVKLCGYKTIKARDIAIVEYMLETDSTCRQAGEHFNLSKTTIEGACHHVIEMGIHNTRYSKKGRDIRKLFECHIERAKFPKYFWKWFEHAKKKVRHK